MRRSGSLDFWLVCIQISMKFSLKAKITKKIWKLDYLNSLRCLFILLEALGWILGRIKCD